MRRLLAAADLAGVTVALVVAALLARPEHGDALFLWSLTTLPVWLILFKVYGLYDRDGRRVSHSTVDDLPWLFHALVVGGLAMWLYFKVAPEQTLTFVQMLTFGVLALTTTSLLRWLVRATAARALRPERVALVSGEAMTKLLVRKIRAHPEYGLEPIGALSPGAKSTSDALPTLGDLGDLPRLVREHDVDRIVVSPTCLDTEDQLQLLRQSRELAVKVNVLPQLFDAMGPAVTVDDVEGVTLLGLNPPVLGRSSRALKRALDLTLSLVLAIALLPVMLLAAIAIKLGSSGPIFFSQERIGKGGRRFRLWKFRTMVRDAEQLVDDLRVSSKDPDWLFLESDPRITRVGRILRLTSLDELPQLLNVIKGDMSLVGPRPLIEDEDRRVDGWARTRLNLTPGITGSWQVLGRTNIPFEEMVKLDYLYVANWSLWNDMRLMLRTLPAVLLRRGAN